MYGDWWNFGENHYGNRKAFVEHPSWNGPPFETCATYGWVCRIFKASIRIEVLTFKHHRIIAPLMKADPELAKKILDWCEEPLKEGEKSRVQWRQCKGK